MCHAARADTKLSRENLAGVGGHAEDHQLALVS